MKLSVGTNWDLALLNNIKDYPVESVYAKLDTDVFGGGRPAYLLPKVSRNEVEQYIQQAHRHGIKFTYLLNASCLGNKEYTRAFHQAMGELLDWISAIEVDIVTISIPYIVQFVKRHYPHLKVNISVLAHVSTLQRAKFFEELGADMLTIPDTYNRDFRFLSQVRKHVKCDIQLIANLTCLRGCPFQLYHGNLVSHASQSDDELDGYYLDYCILSCIKDKISSPVELIKSAWIRPEDLQVYEEMGIESFKLVERFDTTETMTRIVKAYAERKYNGNLADILNVKSHTKRQIPVNPEPLVRPDLVDISKLTDMEETIYVSDQYIDNQALDGFLEFFKTKDCRTSSCEECGYCHSIAEKVVKIPQADVAINKLNQKLELFLSGTIFKTEQREDLSQLTWNKEAQQRFQQIIATIPPEFQSVAQKAVSLQAEENAKRRDSHIVEKADMIAAFLSETPQSFQADLKRSLKELGIQDTQL